MSEECELNMGRKLKVEAKAEAEMEGSIFL